MYCKECGNKIDENSKFCIFCGTKVNNEQKKLKSLDECPKCKEKRDYKFNFCKKCGFEYKDKADGCFQKPISNKSNSNSYSNISTKIIIICIGASVAISFLRIIISIILK